MVSGPNKIILTLDDVTFLPPQRSSSRKVGEEGSQDPAVLPYMFGPLPGPALTPAPTWEGLVSAFAPSQV